MAMIRCGECNATHPVPADPAITAMKCPYCGAAMVVPDIESRRRYLLEQQREARVAEQQRAHLEREARREAREEAERKEEREERKEERSERRTGRWVGRLMTLIAVLAAPTIIAITVFDLPARLGFGESGADRLAQLSTQLRGTGCTTIAPIRSTYATGTVSQLVTTEPGCVRVLAAGAGDHRTLALRLFDANGKEIAKAKDTLDPQLTHCTAAAGTLRYEVVVGPAAKGRLSHTALRCPDPKAAPSAPAAAPTEPPAPPPPTDKPRGKPPKGSRTVR